MMEAAGTLLTLRIPRAGGNHGATAGADERFAAPVCERMRTPVRERRATAPVRERRLPACRHSPVDIPEERSASVLDAAHVDHRAPARAHADQARQTIQRLEKERDEPRLALAAAGPQLPRREVAGDPFAAPLARLQRERVVEVGVEVQAGSERG